MQKISAANLISTAPDEDWKTVGNSEHFFRVRWKFVAFQKTALCKTKWNLRKNANELLKKRKFAGEKLWGDFFSGKAD